MYASVNYVLMRANASLVRPCQRPDRQNEADTTAQVLIAGTYAKTTARGHGQHQAFVSSVLDTSTTDLFLLCEERILLTIHHVVLSTHRYVIMHPIR